MVCGTPYLNLIVWGGGVATAAGVRRARKPRIFPHATRPPQAASTPILKNLDNIRTVSDPRLPEASLPVAPPAGAKEYPTALDPRFLSMLYPLLYVLVPAPCVSRSHRYCHRE